MYLFEIAGSNAAQAGLEHVASLLLLLLSAKTILHTKLWFHSIEGEFSSTLRGW